MSSITGISFRVLLPAIGLSLLSVTACGGGINGRDRTDPPGRTAGAPAAAVPVEVSHVRRRDISSFIETNGTLEAENEVDLVARVSAPIVAILVEEGDLVEKGQLLARLDDAEFQAQTQVSRVELHQSQAAYERSKALRERELISPQDFDDAKSRYETAKAQVDLDELQLGYTRITAPFGGLIVARYINLAQKVSPDTRLFRISNFDPLLCPIQVPERDLASLRLGQSAYLTSEAWPGTRFTASVLRVSPVVDAATGTIKVTLGVEGRNKLRPGMFTRVFVKIATHTDAVVIPKAALSLESIGDTVYIADNDVARRREVTLGFTDGDSVEVLSGLSPDEAVIVVGRDGLSDGTPVSIRPHPEPAPAAADAGRGEAALSPGRRARRVDFSKMSSEQLERAKEVMRARGMSEEQIHRRIQGGRAKPGPRQP
ncbi:MAG: efflux RND transporter periplasmic adaptor subunit [Acidobacteriota bacterium]